MNLVMPNHEEIDVESQLRGLFQEAEDHLALSKRAEGAKIAPRPADERVSRPPLSPAHILRPVLLGLEALVRASGENAALLGKLDDKLDKASEGVSDAHKAIPNLIESLQSMLDQKNGVNQRMFDALHEELKGYKDGFLLESVLKPVICDLISLYDDLSLVRGQMQDVVANGAGNGGSIEKFLLDRLKTMETNIQHNCEFIVEVLARLEVSMLPLSTGKLDKRNQRAVAIEAADDPTEDGDIVQVKKRGFFWKGRVLRAEDVIIKKWRQTPPAIANSSHSQK
jgi:molecular chaperone GrpE (heat shock protein)